MPVDNSIEHLHPDLAKVYAEAKTTFLKANGGAMRPRLSETARSNAVQAAYYAQGRKSLTEINKLRQVAGLPAIGLTEAKSAITKAQPGQSPHNFLPARAFDVVLVLLDGSITWNELHYILFAAHVKAAAAKLNVAISQGAYWKTFKDYPHTELLNWRSMRS